MNKQYLITIILIVVVGASAFFAGTKYQDSKKIASRQTSFSNNRTGQMPLGQRQQGLRPVNGEILSQDDKSITVKSQDGSSKIVILSNSTTINKTREATKEDLKVGEKVVIFGTEGSDGSITAQNVQLNPMTKFLPNQEQK